MFNSEYCRVVTHLPLTHRGRSTSPVCSCHLALVVNPLPLFPSSRRDWEMKSARLVLSVPCPKFTLGPLSLRGWRKVCDVCIWWINSRKREINQRSRNETTESRKAPRVKAEITLKNSACDRLKRKKKREKKTLPDLSSESVGLR